MDRSNFWTNRKNGRWRKCLSLPAYLPAVYQLGVCANRIDAACHPFLCRNQPVTSIVEAIRSLLAEQPVGNDIWLALAWCFGILIVSSVFTMRAYKRKAASEISLICRKHQVRCTNYARSVATKRGQDTWRYGSVSETTIVGSFFMITPQPHDY
jgi:hypothetical protein